MKKFLSKVHPVPASRMKKGKLFYKFLIIFLVVSLGPLGYAGYYLINLSQDTLTSDEDSSAIDLVDDALIWMVTARGFVSVGEPEQALMYAGMARAEVKKARVWDSERYAKVWSIMGVSRHQVDFIGTDR